MRTFLVLMVVGALLPVVAGCGHDDDGLPDAGTEDAHGDIRDGDVIEDDAEPGDDVAPEAELDSPEADDGDAGGEEDGSGEAEIAALAAELYASPGQACTVTVRLDYLTLVPLGYQVFCGPRATLTEAEQARSRAMLDTGYTRLPDTLNPPDPGDEWVFAFEPIDLGAEAAVSADTGLTVFGATTVWAGSGDVEYPVAWRDPAELGSGCSPAGGIPTNRSYDFSGWYPPLPSEIQAALDVVLQTAVPAAFWRHGAVFDAVVLRYPRTVGGPDPFWAPTSEWIVLVNGGSIE